MIFRKYGSKVESVVPNFDSRAMNEIGFQRTNETSLGADEFESQYTRVEGQELTAQAEGGVQDEAEQAVLAQLLTQLEAMVGALKPGEVLLVESEVGKDYPKTREKQRTIVVDGENRMRFERTVEPPLRIGIYAEKR